MSKYLSLLRYEEERCAGPHQPLYVSIPLMILFLFVLCVSNAV